MKLQRIEIRHLPGIHVPLLLDGFGPAINVVTGPNASGKSSLIRALHHLIDEAPERDGGALTLEADFASDGKLWTVTRSGSDVIWQQAGRRVERPALPRGDFLQCYWLSMNELLEAGKADQEIAAHVKRALSGGYDLEAIRSDARFQVNPQFGRRRQSLLRDAEKARRGVLRSYEQLERERQRLPQLERQIRESDAAARRAEKAEHALEWLAARRQRRALEAQLEDFPPEMERLTGREAQQLQELEARRQALVAERAAASDSKAAAETQRVETGLADHPPDRTHLEIRRQEIEEARDAWNDMQHLRKQHSEARAAEATASSALQPQRERLPDIGPDAVDRAVRVAERLRQLERRVHELEAQPETEPVEAETLAAHEALADELRRWLRQLEPARYRRLFAAGLTALGFTLASALTAGSAGGLLAAVLAGLGAAAALWLLAQFIALGNTSAAAEARANEQPLPPPASWTAADVTRRLNDLEDEKTALRRRHEHALETAARRRELEALQAELDEARAEREALASEIGFDPAKTAEGVARFLGLAGELDRARTKLRALRLSFDELQKKYKDRLSRVGAYLVAHRARADSDALNLQTVRAQLGELERRAHALREAERTIVHIERSLQRLDREINAVDTQIETLYRNADIAVGDRETLCDRCERVEAYRRLKTERDGVKIREQERRRGVTEDEELVRLVDAGDEAGLQQTLTELRALAQSLSAQRDELADLRARLAHAGRDRELERAELERNDARDALRKAYGQAMRADAGSFLLDDIAAEHRADQEPPVLAAARERFAWYTNNRYSLRVDDEGRILAWDNRHATRHSLHTLSTGTRMQLLIAVRLAWTSVMEGGAQPLPILLDEALTTSDPERFTSIARQLKDAAEREDRQILYLSAEPADLRRWELAIGEQPAHIDLGHVGSAAAPAAAGDYRLAEPDRVDPPLGMTAEEYAAHLAVPQADPRQDAGEIHIFHLMRDELELLHALMNDWRVTRLGPLEQLLRSEGGVHAVSDGATRERLIARCRTARAWVAAWRQGRGRAVDRNALEASGAVTDRFIDELSALAERLNGDAKRLLEALENREVAGFHRSKIGALAEWLEDEGYLDAADMLDREERERAALFECAKYAPASEIRRMVASLESSADRTDASRDSIDHEQVPCPEGEIDEHLTAEVP